MKAALIQSVLWAMLLSLSLTFGACDSETGRPLAVTTIEQGFFSGIGDTVYMAMRDSVAWRKLWTRHVSHTWPSPELPTIDFDSEMVLVVFVGPRSSGGYTASILRVVEHEDARRCAVKKPGLETTALLWIWEPNRTTWCVSNGWKDRRVSMRGLES